MEKKPEKIIYNPEEHVSLDVDKSETGNEWMRNPESFASLQAIVDAEKAQIIAEQINKEANSLFTDFAEATAMLAVAESEEDKEYLQEEISSIREKITEFIEKRRSSTKPGNLGSSLEEDRANTFEDVLALSKAYQVILGNSVKSFAGVRSGTTRMFLSEKEEGILIEYDKKAKEMLAQAIKKANVDQERILSFLAEKEFKVPIVDVGDDNFKKNFGGVFLRAIKDTFFYSLGNKKEPVDESVYLQKIAKVISKIVDSSNGRIFFDPLMVEQFLAKEETRNYLRLLTSFNVTFNFPKGHLGHDVISSDGMGKSASWVEGENLINISYDTRAKYYGNQTPLQNLVVPDLPAEVNVKDIPFRYSESGSDLEDALRRSRMIKEWFETDPDKALNHIASRLESAENKLSLRAYFEDGKNVSPSLEFL